MCEFRPFILHCRGRYRAEYAGQPDAEAKVAARLVKLMEWLNVPCPCGRNMILNADSRSDFLARRDTY